MLFGCFSVYRCSLEAIRYSLGTRTVDKTLSLPPCDPANPFKLDNPDQFVLRTSGAAQTISIQLLYADGTSSPIRTYEPCNFDQDSTCGRLLRE